MAARARGCACDGCRESGSLLLTVSASLEGEERKGGKVQARGTTVQPSRRGPAPELEGSYILAWVVASCSASGADVKGEARSEERRLARRTRRRSKFIGGRTGERREREERKSGAR